MEITNVFKITDDDDDDDNESFSVILCTHIDGLREKFSEPKDQGTKFSVL